MTLHMRTLPSLLAVAMLAGSSFAFAADNPQKDPNEATRDEQSTGSISTEGRTPTPDERERCQTAPANDPVCQSLGLAPNE